MKYIVLPDYFRKYKYTINNLYKPLRIYDYTVSNLGTAIDQNLYLTYKNK